MASLSNEERRSLTHGDFWIPEHEREVYRQALRTLNECGVPYVVSGLYAMYYYTGVYRQTKDLDLFFEPRWVIPAARALKDAGFAVHVEDEHWLAKAMWEDIQVDLIFGMGNGIALLDEEWYTHSRAGILAAVPVRVAPAEELLWHRLYVNERHRHDMADVLHLFLCRGSALDWDRLMRRLDRHFELLLAHVLLFDFAYPGQQERIPERVRDELRARMEQPRETPADPDLCQGTLISRFSFNIDVNDWGFHDLRQSAIEATGQLPIVRQISESDVWER
jgi:hypothetical protein